MIDISLMENILSLPKNKMKKILSITLMLVAAFGMAQKGRLEFGISGGLNAAKVSNAEEQAFFEVDPNYGINIGLSVDYFLSSHWSVKGKLVYDQKGLDGQFLRRPSDEASGFSFREVNSDFKMDYLTIPVSVNWHFGKKVEIEMGVGGYVGVLLDSNDDEHQFELGRSRRFSKTDFGAVGALVAKYRLTDEFKIGLEYELQQGFSEVYKSQYSVDLTHYNSRHSINIGCYYSL